MTITVTAMNGVSAPQTLARFTTPKGLSDWLKNPNLPYYYKNAEWVYDDLSNVLAYGGRAVLGGAFYSVGGGLMDWDSFHLEVRP